MFCPNCGVEINTLEKCEICGADLQLLQKMNLVKDTPPKNNYSNISAYARSLKSRRMSVDKFLEEQKAYLANSSKSKEVSVQKDANNISENKFNFGSMSSQGRSIFGGRSKEQNASSQNVVENQSQPVQNIQPNAEPQVVAQQAIQNPNGQIPVQQGVQQQPQMQSQFQQNNQQAQQLRFQPPTQPNSQPVQNANSEVYLKEEDFVKDEFDIPKINGVGENNQVHQGGQINNNQNVPQQAPMQQMNVQQGTPAGNANPQNNNAQATYDDFVIPAINSNNNEQSNVQTNNGNFNQTAQVVQQANQLSAENDKKIKKLKTGKKARSRCSTFAMVLAVLVSVVTILYFVLNKVEIKVEFVEVIKKFVLTNQIYFIWGIMGVGVLSLLFMLIGLISGKTKFKWIAMVLIIILIGAVAYYLYSEKLLISSFNKFLALFKK